MIRLPSIYNGFWKCRDLEIQMLWTRLTLLGGLLALTYTGYGVLILKEFELASKGNWTIFNLLAIGACCFGVVFSVFWITTAKGSKFWYEYYESVIGHFQRENKTLFEADSNKERILSYLDFDSITPPDADRSLLTSCGGHFSVSRIPIVLGQVSMLVWMALILVHMACLVLGCPNVKVVLDALGLKIAIAMLIACAFVVAIVLKNIQSGFGTNL